MGRFCGEKVEESSNEKRNGDGAEDEDDNPAGFHVWGLGFESIEKESVVNK